jgi:hypothetical protein
VNLFGRNWLASDCLDADAVIKCLASAVATGILLFLSPAISGTSMTPLTVPGGLIVFISSWLYVKSAPKKSAEEEAPKLSLGQQISEHLPCIPASEPSFLPSFPNLLTVSSL